MATVTSSTANKMWKVANSAILLGRSSSTKNALGVRSFAAAAAPNAKKANKKKGGKDEAAASYFARKQALKESRTQQYQAKVGSVERKKTRRNAGEKDAKKNAFQEWWQPRRVYEEILDRKARQQNKPFQYKVAVLLERLPIVVPDKESWENDYDELYAYLSQFGKDYPKEFSAATPPKVVAISDEELLEALPKGFTPAPRVTAADESGELATLDRKLKDRVYYMVKDGDSWDFPTVTLEAGDDSEETLLEAAKRAIQKNGGKDLELYYPSHAPMAVNVTKNGDDNDAFFGTKTFYLRVQYDDGKITKKSKNDFAWLDRQEIVEQMSEQHGDDEGKFYHYML